MKLLYCLIIVFAVEWVAYGILPDEKLWYFMFVSKQLSIAMALQLAFNSFSNTSLKYNFILVMFCSCAWIDFILDIVWVVAGIENSTVAPISTIIFTMLMWLLYRNYNIKSDIITSDNVYILLLKPRSFISFIKSVCGVPVVSVCIVADGYVWSFRTNRDCFCKTKLSDRWLSSHIVIDTGVKNTQKILESLHGVVGEKRGCGVRCVYGIKEILTALGYKPRFIFQYIPCFYAMKILGEKR